MAEASYLWDNPGTGDSPAPGYGNALLCQVIFRMLYNGTLSQGVLLGWLNDLEVTDGGGLNAAVDTGAAFNYGVWYENTSAVNVAIANNATEWVVVRASWAAQTSRLVAIAPGAFTQTAGVTYDIPLAAVTTVAGVITLVADLRDYCVLSTDLRDYGVSTEMIAADAATIAKVADQDRWFLRGAGAFAPDGTNPATWTNIGMERYRDEWTFVDAATSAGWYTIRVPADITSANLTIYLWYAGITPYVTGDGRWTYSIWQAGSGGVAANTAAAVTLIADTNLAIYNGYLYAMRQGTLVAQPVTAGDVLHIQLARTGAHGGDTYNGGTIIAAGLFFHYTADS